MTKGKMAIDTIIEDSLIVIKLTVTDGVHTDTFELTPTEAWQAGTALAYQAMNAVQINARSS